MDSVEWMVKGLGGLAQKQQLLRLGASDRMLAAAVRSGVVVRARQGWYSTLGEHELALRAARVGGRLTGMSALIVEGAWTWLDEYPLHVSVPRRASRLREQWDRFRRLDPSAAVDIVIHWDEDAIVRRGVATRVALRDALATVVLTEPFEIAVTVFDWAFKSGMIDRFGVEEIMLDLPADARMIANWIDPRCDSVLESVVRSWLQLRGHHVRSQVGVGDFERIDLVIDDAVALELGGKTHEGRREADWRKNVRITTEGRHPILATYSMVRYEFEALVTAIETALRGHRFGSGSVANSGIHVAPAPLGRRIWRLTDGSAARIPEFPTGGVGVWRE